jgi:light-regulated signal transduction histidine kinase (bacteriophytochrome)
VNSTFTNDPERFKEIASNLLQNAVKYTDRGSITVTFKESKSTNSVVLEVSDTGVGIPPGAVGNIFEPFIQVHKTSTENSRGGIGLGLSIVKKHTEQMQGHVSVVSDLSKGSTFKVIFPSLLRGRPKTPNDFLSRINARLKYRSRTKRQPGFDGIDRLPVTVRQKSHEQNSISKISTTS